MVASFSCTGLGLVMAAMSLRVRETAVLANVLFGTLLIFCGVNVPLSSMPSWMQSVAAWLPMTHSISAARGLAASASWSTVLPDVRAEVVIGLMYLAIGMAMLRWLERESRRHATLEIA
jgi:ABC-2 type transport system permease protein